MSTILLLGTLTGILMAVGWLLGGPWGVAAGLALAAAINGLSYWYSDRLVLRLYSAQPYQNDRLQGVLARLAGEAKIPAPRLYLVKSSVMNAFATGRSPRHAAVAVTEGLLGLKDEEIEGVLAHEISHIRNRDMLISTMAATMAGAIGYIAQIGYFSLFAGEERQQSILPMILIIVFTPLAAFLVRLAISRSREYKADWTGALLTKKPEALASALRKISATAREQPLHGPSATAHLWIENPFKHDLFNSLFSTHPPVEKRVERLEVLRTAA